MNREGGDDAIFPVPGLVRLRVAETKGFTPNGIRDDDSVNNKLPVASPSILAEKSPVRRAQSNATA